VSEKDLGQKIEMRQAFWAMGATTRIDVKLGAFVDPARSKTRAGAEEWTDLDVLGVLSTPFGGTQFVVADCKTSRGRVTERVFWLRGVADLFGAQAAYLTRDGDIPESARQLGLRLRVSAFDGADRATFLEQLGSALLPSTGAFLELDTMRRWTRLTLETPEAIARLQRYRQSFYWLVRRGRNLTGLPTAIGRVSKAFDPDQRWAHALVADLAWLYLVAILDAVDGITRLHLADVSGGLLQAVVGSEQDRREKETLARQLGDLFTHIDPSVQSRLPPLPIRPAYFNELVDLVARVSRLRAQVTGALRALEFTGVETIANVGARWTDAFPAADPREAKLASDVIRFLVRSCGLNPEFVTRFDQLTLALNDGSAPVALETRIDAAATGVADESANDDRVSDQDGTLFRPDSLSAATSID
jgi:hypothetical protein